MKILYEAPYKILNEINNHNNQNGVIISYIARKQKLTGSYIVKVVREMEEQGFINKELYGRCKIIKITNKGKEIIKAMEIIKKLNKGE